MIEILTLTSAEVQATMIPVEAQSSYSDVITQQLEETVFGQHDAMKAIARRLAMFDTGLQDPNRPLGSMFFLGPSGCLHEKTPIYDPVDKTTKTVRKRCKEGKSFHIYSLDERNNIVITEANPPQRFTKEKMWRVSFSNGSSLSVTYAHRFFSGTSYNELSTLHQQWKKSSSVLLPTISEHDLSRLFLNGQRSSQTSVNFQADYRPLYYLYGLPLRLVKGIYQAFSQLSDDVGGLYYCYFYKGGLVNKLKHSRHYQWLRHLSIVGLNFLVNSVRGVLYQFQQVGYIFSQLIFSLRLACLPHVNLNPVYKGKSLNQSSLLSKVSSHLLAYIHGITGLGLSQITEIKSLGKSYYYDFEVPKYHNYWACGVFNHNSGKTESARAAQKVMGLPDDRLKIINMAEYQKDHYISRFVGSPPSYVGYNEEPAIPHEWLHKGRSIIVFDEIDKAHPDIRQVLLGVLDKGVMDARDKQKGTQPLNFNNSLLIFTSNIAAQEIHKITQGHQGIGFHGEAPDPLFRAKRIAQEAQKGLEGTLSPEFINRLDDIVVFQELIDPLLYDRMLTKFIDLKNSQLQEQFQVPASENGMAVKDNKGRVIYISQAPYFAVTSEFREFILGKVHSKGGRELRRVLDREMFDLAADVFVGMDVKNRPLVANYEDGRVVFYTDKIQEKPTEVFVEHIKVKKKQSLPDGPIPTDGEGDKKTKVSGEDEKVETVPEETGDEEKGMEDIKKIGFMIPFKPRYSMDLAITVYDRKKEIMAQMMEGVPLVPLE